jgi:hypothetical protein
MDGDEFGAVGGMIDKGNRSTRRNPSPVALFQPQIPHDLTRAGTRAASVESQRLTDHQMRHGTWEVIYIPTISRNKRY